MERSVREQVIVEGRRREDVCCRWDGVGRHPVDGVGEGAEWRRMDCAGRAVEHVQHYVELCRRRVECDQGVPPDGIIEGAAEEGPKSQVTGYEDGGRVHEEEDGIGGEHDRVRLGEVLVCRGMERGRDRDGEVDGH